MQIIAILLLCVASTMAGGYGSSSGFAPSSGARLVASEPALLRSSGGYSSAPLLKSSGYGSSAILTEPTVVRTTSSFKSEPTLLRNSGGYSSAPIVKSSGYGASSVVLSEPALIRSSGYASEPALVRTSSLVEDAPVIRTEAAHIPIVKYLRNDDNYGTYNLEVQSGDGSSQSERGVLREVGGPEAEGPVSVKEGSYSFTSPEGQLFTVHYTADENGFRASGAHLPTPPPIPAEIAASLRGASSYGGELGGVVRTVSSEGYSSAPVQSFQTIRSGGY